MGYEKELKTLMQWLFDEEDKLETGHTPQPGFDDWRTAAVRPLQLEFKRRWVELKRRYGIPAE